MVLIFELNNQNYKIQYLKLNILNLPNITNMTNTHIFSYENTITKYSYIRVFYTRPPRKDKTYIYLWGFIYSQTTQYTIYGIFV